MIIYKEKATLKRLSPDSADSDKEGYIVVTDDLYVNIQPMGSEYIALSPMGDVSKTYQGFTTYTGISPEMLIETSELKLKVAGVDKYDGPLGKHYQLLLREISK